jgi:benzoyl-CoA reductase/2-hydroxyglutaryl-CoA dehydratase subunit BcrC/BadD/HgdB
MTDMKKQKIGFTCAYTPIAIVDAAGFVPYRVLPVTDVPDQAGRILHDNLCPHVKRVLDRALENDLPEDLAGMIFMNSCDAMRRLADAWMVVRPKDHVMILDLPVTGGRTDIAFFAQELERLSHTLAAWSGNPITADQVARSVEQYNQVADKIRILNGFLAEGKLEGSGKRLQELINQTTSIPFTDSLKFLDAEIQSNQLNPAKQNGIPVFLFGNVMPDPDFFSLIEDCGVRIIGNDFCTSTRMFEKLSCTNEEAQFTELSRQLLNKPPCARTFDPARPGKIADDVIQKAKSLGAHGMIGHSLKFCDPYLARLPMVRDAVQGTDIPLLLLEGDCTLRSFGQQRTRIEAFVEMLR